MPARILAQTTPTGRTYYADAFPDGRLGLPFGDYNANTGGDDVIVYDPVTGESEVLLTDFGTEQIFTYRTFPDGSVWTAPVDPLNRDVAQVATNRGGPWHTVAAQPPAVGVAVHMYDVAPTSVGAAVCGARNWTEAEVSAAYGPGAESTFDYEASGVAFVWETTDNGATWAEVIADYSPTDGYHRLYGFGKIGDRLYVAPANGTGYYRRAPGGGWSTKTSLPVGGSAWYFPPAWGDTMFTCASTAKAYTADGAGALVVQPPRVPLPARFLHVDGDDAWWVTSGGYVASDSAGVMGRLLPAVNPYVLRGAVAPDGVHYLSTGAAIYRVNLPD